MSRKVLKVLGWNSLWDMFDSGKSTLILHFYIWSINLPGFDATPQHYIMSCPTTKGCWKPLVFNLVFAWNYSVCLGWNMRAFDAHTHRPFFVVEDLGALACLKFLVVVNVFFVLCGWFNLHLHWYSFCIQWKSCLLRMWSFWQSNSRCSDSER